MPVNGSAESSPDVSIAARETTVPTTVSDEEAESTASFDQSPAVPANTPANTIAGSQVPDTDYIEQSMSYVRMVSGGGGETSSLLDANEPSHLPQRHVSSGNGDASDTTETETETEACPEHSNWAELAEEDVATGLTRMAMLARDEHQADPSKTVEQYYSERLAKLIRGAEIRFDVGCLE